MRRGGPPPTAPSPPTEASACYVELHITCESEAVTRISLLHAMRQGMAGGRLECRVAGRAPEWRGCRSGRGDDRPRDSRRSCISPLPADSRRRYDLQRTVRDSHPVREDDEIANLRPHCGRRQECLALRWWLQFLQCSSDILGGRGATTGTHLGEGSARGRKRIRAPITRQLLQGVVGSRAGSRGARGPHARDHRFGSSYLHAPRGRSLRDRPHGRVQGYVAGRSAPASRHSQPAGAARGRAAIPLLRLALA